MEFNRNKAYACLPPFIQINGRRVEQSLSVQDFPPRFNLTQAFVSILTTRISAWSFRCFDAGAMLYYFLHVCE